MFKPWNTFVSDIAEWENSLSDVISSSKDLYYADGDIARVLDYSALFEAPVKHEANVTDHAMRQIRDRLDGPRMDWLNTDERCSPELRARIINSLLHEREDKRWMYRLRDHGGDAPDLRAVLSDQYNPFNHHDLVSSVNAAFEMNGLGDQIEVFRPEIDNSMRAYLLYPVGPIDENGRGGGVRPAVYISNSEVGVAKVRITGGTFTSVCQNGMIGGWNTESAFEFTHRWHVTPQHLKVRVNEAIAVAMQFSEKLAVKFLETQAVLIQPTSLSDIVGRMSDKYGLTVSAQEDWLSLVGSRGITQFDLISSATEIARDLSNTDERESMERMAGDLVFAEIPRDELVPSSRIR